MKILIVDDEYNLADAIKSMLQKQKYIVEIKTNGEDGLDEALSDSYDLIILDVMLPGMNGFDILKEIRKENINSKVIMLSAKSAIDDKMMGFNGGANDYLTKPFHMDELLARVNLQLRTNDNGVESNFIEFGDLKLDIQNMNIININTKNEINVIGKEFQLLELLMRNTKQIISKEQVFSKIWGYDSDSDINTLEAYVSFLRKKLKLIKSNVSLKAIRGVGYKLEVINEETKK